MQNNFSNSYLVTHSENQQPELSDRFREINIVAGPKTIRLYARVLKEWWKFLLACTLGLGVVGFLSKMIHPAFYTASSTIQVTPSAEVHQNSQ